MLQTARDPIFDDAQLAQLRRTLRPLAAAHTMPPWCYTNEAFYAAEIREIFTQEWLGVGRVDEIATPGDYLCVDIAGEPIVVLRDRDGVVRAFSRACRHRGACVVEGRGNARFFRCPFHGWTYDLRGNLIAARQMEQTGDFDPSRWPLAEIRTEIWQGIVFVNLNHYAEPLAPRLTGLDAILERYHLADLRATDAMSFWNECNWKLSCEQAMDMYHVPDTHYMPRSGPRVGKTFIEEDPGEHWTISYSPLEREHPNVTGTNQQTTHFPAIEGLNPFERSTLNLFLIYPNTVVGMLPYGALVWFLYPEGVRRTNVVLNLYLSAPAFEIEGFDEHLRETQEGFIVTNNQDMHSARITQIGMGSRLLEPGRYSYLEQATWELDKYVIRKLAGAHL